MALDKTVTYLAKVHPVCLLPQLGNSVPLLHLTNATTSSAFTRAFEGCRQGLGGLARWRLLKLFHLLLDLKMVNNIVTPIAPKS